MAVGINEILCLIFKGHVSSNIIAQGYLATCMHKRQAELVFHGIDEITFLTSTRLKEGEG